MNDNSKFCLTKTDFTEFETALAELTSTERHILFRLMELHPIEDVLGIISRMEENEDKTSDHHFSAFDPYAKYAPATHTQNHSVRIGKDGCICVKNPSAC